MPCTLASSRLAALFEARRGEVRGSRFTAMLIDRYTNNRMSGTTNNDNTSFTSQAGNSPRTYHVVQMESVVCGRSVYTSSGPQPLLRTGWEGQELDNIKQTI